MDGRRHGARPRFCNVRKFQINFYDNLFNPDQNSEMQDKKRLNKKTIEILLNKLFVLDK